ncbi:hypothetical protein ACR2R6_03800 [Methylocaldum gracile subsp. desertum]|uniref:hypothetical protein n=1 Tax=Methylocaldum sp. GT1BW TaxID=3438964 RepID=UPI003DA1658D
MAETNNSDSTYSSAIGAATGYISGAMNSAHFQQALDIAKAHGIPLAGSGINAAGNFVSAQFAFVAILSAGLTNGANGVSNASFSAAMGALAGAAWGPAAGTAVGSAYGSLLDYISNKTHEYDVGGQIYDLEQMLKDPEFWDLVEQHAEDLFKPLLDPLTELGHWLGQNLPTPYDIQQWVNDIQQQVNDLFNAARGWVQPYYDPLALDLDGDGIETVGVAGSGTVLFDHDGDGLKQGTGWVKSDDGLLVLDRNGNGVIDNGAELFGVDTVLSDGQKATDGCATWMPTPTVFSMLPTASLPTFACGAISIRTA